MASYYNGKASADAVRAMRDRLQQGRDQQGTKRFEFNEKNYLNLRLNPNETTKNVKVRILPVSADDPNIFSLIHTHSLKVPAEISKSGYKSFICLNENKLKEHESGKNCPLCEKSKQLLAECNSLPNDEAHKMERKSLFIEAMKFKAKETFIVRVIERGKEEDGVKFWRFNSHTDGTGVYDQLMSIFDNRSKESIDEGDAYYRKIVNGNTDQVEYEKIEKEEYDRLPANQREIMPYNVFDVYDGKDFIITLEYVPSTQKTTMKISDAGKPTPLSKNPDQIDKWINDSKTWTDLYSFKSYEFLQLVADGKTPYFDKTEGKWVDKATIITDENVADIAKEALVADNATGLDLKPEVNNGEDDGDDLPF